MKKFLVTIIIILNMLFIGVFALDNDESWTQVDSNNYINYENIVGLEDVYGFFFLLKSYNKGQYEPVNGKRIWYTMSQYSIDCTRQKYKIGIIDSYGYSNNFINGDYNRYAEYQPIVKGTAVSLIAERLCKQ